MSDLFDFSEDNIPESPEEREKVIRDIVEGQSTRAAFYDAANDRVVTFEELVKELGQEKAIKFLDHLMQEGKAKSISMKSKDIDKLIDKYRSGKKCTQEERKLAEIILSSVNKSNNVTFLKNFNAMIVELIKCAREEIEYSPSLSTVADAFTVFMFSCLSKTVKFNSNDMFSILEKSNYIGKDILDTWMNSCTKKPDDGLIILGLLNAIINIIAQNHLEIPDVNYLINFLHLEDFYDDEEKNGSNKEIDLRDLLKE